MSNASAGYAQPANTNAALDFLRRLAGEVSKGSVDLPCFPEVVLRIRSALADPNSRPDKIVALIGTEPRLGTKLLKTANSAAFNTTGKPITELRVAITRLGHQLVQSAAMAFAVQQMKYAQSLRTIAKPLSELWLDCILIASVSQVVAARTKVSPDQAFLAGLLHGIGRLYIMVRAAGMTQEMGDADAFMNLIADWHASIGKAVLENWGFAEELCIAVGDQNDHERRWKHDEELSDVLIAAVALGGTLKDPARQLPQTHAISAFHHIHVSDAECAVILAEADRRIASLHEALGV